MPTPMRKRPDDFEAMLNKLGSRALCQHYTAGPSIIARWRKEIGRAGGAKGGMVATPVPEDFHLYAVDAKNSELADRYGTSQTMITRWRREAGIRGKPRGGIKPRGVFIRPVPEGFAELARCNTTKALCRIYKAGDGVIGRWRQLTDAYFNPPKPVKEPKVRIAREPRKRKLSASFVNQIGKPHQSIVPPRDGSIEGDAAQVLRAYAPVYRCDERGRQGAPQIAKRFWRYGATVLSPDELLERARAKGWACVI